MRRPNPELSGQYETVVMRVPSAWTSRRPVKFPTVTGRFDGQLCASLPSVLYTNVRGRASASARRAAQASSAGEPQKPTVAAKTAHAKTTADGMDFFVMFMVDLN